jgi:hypothetical protein
MCHCKTVSSIVAIHNSPPSSEELGQGYGIVLDVESYQGALLPSSFDSLFTARKEEVFTLSQNKTIERSTRMCCAAVL